jgi:hypothetical protein
VFFPSCHRRSSNLTLHLSSAPAASVDVEISYALAAGMRSAQNPLETCACCCLAERARYRTVADVPDCSKPREIIEKLNSTKEGGVLQVSEGWWYQVSALASALPFLVHDRGNRQVEVPESVSPRFKFCAPVHHHGFPYHHHECVTMRSPSATSRHHPSLQARVSVNSAPSHLHDDDPGAQTTDPNDVPPLKPSRYAALPAFLTKANRYPVGTHVG